MQCNTMMINDDKHSSKALCIYDLIHFNMKRGKPSKYS